jgi:hypothetical protein
VQQVPYQRTEMVQVPVEEVYYEQVSFPLPSEFGTVKTVISQGKILALAFR